VGEKTTTVQKAKVVAKPKVRKEQDIEDAPLYKVMLLGDEEYDVGHIVTRLCEVMEDMDENLAATVFKSAQVAGKAMCGKYPLEHAELYVEQLLRSDPMIFAELEEEDKIS
jgi:ATP-dependent Clp protease adapter protein ClpS